MTKQPAAFSYQNWETQGPMLLPTNPEFREFSTESSTSWLCINIFLIKLLWKIIFFYNSVFKVTQRERHRVICLAKKRVCEVREERRGYENCRIQSLILIADFRIRLIFIGMPTTWFQAPFNFYYHSLSQIQWRHGRFSLSSFRSHFWFFPPDLITISTPWLATQGQKRVIKNTFYASFAGDAWLTLVRFQTIFVQISVLKLKQTYFLQSCADINIYANINVISCILFATLEMSKRQTAESGKILKSLRWILGYFTSTKTKKNIAKFCVFQFWKLQNITFHFWIKCAWLLKWEFIFSRHFLKRKARILQWQVAISRRISWDFLKFSFSGLLPNSNNDPCWEQVS